MDPAKLCGGATSGSASGGDNEVTLARTDADLCRVLSEFYQEVQSDLGLAKVFAERALEMLYAIHPEGKKAKTRDRGSLHQLGGVLQAIGDLKGARAKYEASLEIKYAIHPEGKKAKTSGIAASLHQLGSVLEDIGDLKGARASTRRRWRWSTRSIPRERRQRRVGSRRRFAR